MSNQTTSDHNAIDCPACGEENTDLNEYDFGPAELLEIECAAGCGETFVLRRDVSVTYTAYVKEQR